MKTLYIEPGSPWENGYNESFNGTLGEEVLKREIFYSLEEAKVLTGQWRREYNTIRPHSSLRYRPTAIESCTGLAIENCTLGGGDEASSSSFSPLLLPSFSSGVKGSTP